MRPILHPPRPLPVESMAGWIFADLLLVLFLVGLGSQMGAAGPDIDGSPAPSAQPAAMPGMDPQPRTRRIVIEPDRLLVGDADARARAVEQIAAVTSDLAGRRAAMVLLWGESPDVVRGQAIARTVGELLQEGQPEVFDGAGAQRHLWQGTSAEGAVGLEIYLFTPEGEPS